MKAERVNGILIFEAAINGLKATHFEEVKYLQDKLASLERDFDKSSKENERLHTELVSLSKELGDFKDSAY